MRNALGFSAGAILVLLPFIALAQTPEPILYYSFDKGTVSCISGDPVTDLSGSGYNGTLSVNATLAGGTFGNSLYFTPGTYVDVGLPLFSTTDAYQPYTISFWVKAEEGTGGAFVTQYDMNAADSNLRWGTDNRTNQGGVGVWWSNGVYQAEGQTTLDDGTWHHIAYVKDAGQNLTIYVDGQDDTDRSGAYPNTHTTPFQDLNTLIGTFAPGTQDQTACLDELMVFEEAVGAEAIRNLYAFNDTAAPEQSILKVDFGAAFPDVGVGGQQYIPTGWRGMTAAPFTEGGTGPVTQTFGYDDTDVTLTVDSTSEEAPRWQNRARPSTYNCYINHPIGDVANDFAFCFGEGEAMQLILEGLPAGEHFVRTYHHDTNANYGSVNVSVTDADGADRLVHPDQQITYGGGNSAADNDPDPGIIGTVPMKVVSDGTNPVVISVGPNQTYAHVSGMEITSSLPSDLKIDFQAGNGDTQDGYQAFSFPGTAPSAHGPQSHWFFTELGRNGSAQVTVYREDETANLNFRDRPQVSGNSQADLMEDFVNNNTDLTVSLGNLKPGTYEVTTTYHDVVQACGPVDITVLDSLGQRTVATGVNQTGGNIATPPASVTFTIETDGLLPVDITTLATETSVITQNSIEVERIGEGPQGPFPLKIYLIGGQSNGDGRGDIDALSPELAEKIGIPTYHQDGWKYLQPGLNRASDDMHGVELSFGRDMAEFLPDENVAIIKCAFSGSDLANDWNPDTGADYEIFMNTVAAALAALPDDYVPEIEGMLWIQGEADAQVQEEVAAYEANLTNLISRLRTELDSPEMAFVISELADIPRYAEYGGDILAAQAAVASGDPLAGLVSVDDLPLNPDGYHYSSAGLITLGERMAQEMINLTEGGITLEGDLNDDGTVNSDDLNLVRANWGVSGSLGIPGDATGDGVVNSDDLDIVRANWGRSAAAVPEPGMFCFAVGMFLLVSFRRRA